MALHYNFDTRDDCSKQVQLAGAYRVQRMRLLPIKLMGKNRGMHPRWVRWVHRRRVQLLHAEVEVHPHRVQMHPGLVHFGDYDGASYIMNSAFHNSTRYIGFSFFIHIEARRKITLFFYFVAYHPYDIACIIFTFRHDVFFCLICHSL